ncbi:unannotated protein [freshwater metagenome]|uniref:Unannotated protein n=1 Tax=freshwater metagenome TaxID=449393 RepID=A0A6J6SGK2_9ZZZZ
MPKNVEAPADGLWKTYTSEKSIGGDYIETKRYNALVTVNAQNVRELRLIAQTGPKMGSVKVKIGGGNKYQKVNLYSERVQSFAVFIVRDQFSPLVSGNIQILVTSRNKPVRIDAVLAH